MFTSLVKISCFLTLICMNINNTSLQQVDSKINHLLETLNSMTVQIYKEFDGLISDPANDKIYKHSSCTNTFDPVNLKWKNEVRVNLLKNKIVLEEKEIVQPPKLLTLPKKEVQIVHNYYAFLEKLGFYSALSSIISGFEFYNMQLRNAVMKELQNNEKLLKFVGGEEKMGDFLKEIDVEQSKYFATSVEILASSFVLNTCIYVYETSVNKWTLYHTKFDEEVTDTSNQNCMYLIKRNNAFNVVTDVFSLEDLQNQ